MKTDVSSDKRSKEDVKLIIIINLTVKLVNFTKSVKLLKLIITLNCVCNTS